MQYWASRWGIGLGIALIAVQDEYAVLGTVFLTALGTTLGTVLDMALGTVTVAGTLRMENEEMKLSREMREQKAVFLREREDDEIEDDDVHTRKRAREHGIT